MPAESAPLLPSTAPPAARSTRALLPLLLPLLLLPLFLLVPFLPHPILTTLPSNLPEIHTQVPYVPHTFLAIGDWGRKGKHGQTQVANALGHTVSSRLMTDGYNPHYILSTGDNFYSKGVTSVHDPDFNASFAHVYTHLSLKNLPWYPILGNHDYLGSTTAQLEYSAHDRRWNMPAAFYTHRFTQNLQAVFLDTTPFADDDYGRRARETAVAVSVQLRWLERVLRSAPKGVYFLVVAHHNMYTMSTSGHLGLTPLREQLEAVLAPFAHRVLAYVSGHHHSLMHLQPRTLGPMQFGQGPFTNVVDHFVTGAGSKLDAMEFPTSVQEAQRLKACCGFLEVGGEEGRAVWGESVHGFFKFTFDGVEFTAEAVDANATVIYSYSKKVA
eukprot:GFKZ01005746.1.p1 GENE.GFKZ01005746.1~~GFKZ01005746.1.p1  ORF type:complete len:384 (+),score=36.10 GFKZ01005746.1:72-1223(+)